MKKKKKKFKLHPDNFYEMATDRDIQFFRFGIDGKVFINKEIYSPYGEASLVYPGIKGDYVAGSILISRILDEGFRLPFDEIEIEQDYKANKI